MHSEFQGNRGRDSSKLLLFFTHPIKNTNDYTNNKLLSWEWDFSIAGDWLIMYIQLLSPPQLLTIIFLLKVD